MFTKSILKAKMKLLSVIVLVLIYAVSCSSSSGGSDPKDDTLRIDYQAASIALNQNSSINVKPTINPVGARGTFYFPDPLPVGLELSIDPTTGIITGTAQGFGTFGVKVKFVGNEDEGYVGEATTIVYITVEQKPSESPVSIQSLTYGGDLRVTVDDENAISVGPIIDPLGAVGVFSLITPLSPSEVDISIDPNTGIITGTGLKTGTYQVEVRFVGKESFNYFGNAQTSFQIIVDKIPLKASDMSLSQREITVPLRVSQYSIVNDQQTLMSWTGPEEASITYAIEPVVANKKFSSVTINSQGVVSANSLNSVGIASYKITATATGEKYTGSVTTSITIKTKLIVKAADVVIPANTHLGQLLTVQGGGNAEMQQALSHEHLWLPDNNKDSDLVISGDVVYYTYINSYDDNKGWNSCTKVVYDPGGEIFLRIGVNCAEGDYQPTGALTLFFMVIDKDNFVDNAANLDIVVRGLYSGHPVSDSQQMGVGILTSTGKMTVYKGKGLANNGGRKSVTFSNVSKESGYHLVFEAVRYADQYVEFAEIEITPR